MPKPLVTDELWAVVEPLLAKEPPKSKGGRPRIDDRAALTGILLPRVSEGGLRGFGSFVIPYIRDLKSVLLV